MPEPSDNGEPAQPTPEAFMSCLSMFHHGYMWDWDDESCWWERETDGGGREMTEPERSVLLAVCAAENGGDPQ